MLEVFLLVAEIGFSHLLIKGYLQFFLRADAAPLYKKIVVGFCLLPHKNGVVEVSPLGTCQQGREFHRKHHTFGGDTDGKQETVTVDYGCFRQVVYSLVLGFNLTPILTIVP